MTDSFRRDIDRLYAQAEQADSLSAFIPSLSAVLSHNGESLREVDYAYRLMATDTGYQYAFSLSQGRMTVLSVSETVDVTVSGRETHLLAVFQRRLSPAKALLLGRIHVEGSKAALMQMATFL